ncbi:MAG: cupin [Chloroflexi bacterium]|nr:cupin [Chloroflexota bacterium]
MMDESAMSEWGRPDASGAESDCASTSSRRTFLIGAGTALVGGLITVTTERVGASSRYPAAGGSASSGVSRTPLGRGQVTRGAPMVVEQGSDLAVDAVVMAPGGTTGWHTHPGPEVIVVRSGVLTFRRFDGITCQTEKVSTGQAFVGAAAHQLHAADNEGSEPVDFIASFFDVPHGGATRSDANPPPGGCHGTLPSPPGPGIAGPAHGGGGGPSPSGR